MSKIALSGNPLGSGTFTIASPNSNNNRTLTLPDNTGTVLTTGAVVTAAQGGTGLTSPGASGNILTSDGTNWTSAARLVSGTAQNSTSGTSIDFTGIPSWVKRITVMFSGVSTNGTSPTQVQLGAGSVDTSGYTSGIGGVANAAATSYATSTSGFLCTVGIAAANATSGSITICNIGSNVWVYNSVMSSTSNINSIGGGQKTLSGTLDRVRITTVNGTDTFDAGSINILYE